MECQHFYSFYPHSFKFFDNSPNIPPYNVAYAANAGSADNATNAVNATNAEYATKAGSADNATNATKATNADYATSAGRADKATYAERADYASDAHHATFAEDAGRTGIADIAIHAENAPEWDVYRNIGAISPSLSLNSPGSLIEGIKENERQFIFRMPMINSGELYLAFDIFIDNGIDGSHTKCDVSISIDASINGVPQKQESYTKEFAYNTGGETRSFRCPLNVSAGDDLVLIITASAKIKSSGSSGTIDVSVNNIRFLANIITAHTYQTMEVEG